MNIKKKNMRPICTWVASLAFLAGWSQQPVSLNWVKQWGGSDNDGAIAFKLDNAGNFYVAGWYYAAADLDPGPGTFNAVNQGMRDIYISKFDPSGNLVWAKTQGGSGTDIIFDITLDASGNIFTTGHFNGVADFDPGPGSYTLGATNGNFTESYICKQDPQGNFLWAKKFGNSLGYGAYRLKLDPSGNIYITGIFEGTGDFDPGAGTYNMTAVGNEDAFILKLDAIGNFLWARQIGNTGWNHGLRLDVDVAGNVYAAGEFTGTADLDPGPGSFNATSAGGLDIFLIKLNTSGNFVWAKTFGGSSPDDPTNVVVAPSGNIYLTGIYSSANVDFDPGPGVFNLPFNGWVDIFYMKLDANGNFVWCKGIGGAEYDSPESLVLDASENLYMGGRFRVTTDFDPGPGTFTMSSLGSGADDGYMMRADMNGNMVWAIQLQGNMNYVNGIAIDNAQNVYACGNFKNPTDFDPGPLVYNLYTPSGWPDAYLMKLNQSVGVGLSETTSEKKESFICYPVPFGTELTVSISNSSGNAQISLLSVTGQLILEREAGTQRHVRLPTEELPAGVYFIKVQDGNNVTWKKVMKN
jgi:hypothetical protein